jgi:hypothetical protein
MCQLYFGEPTRHSNCPMVVHRLRADSGKHLYSWDIRPLCSETSYKFFPAEPHPGDWNISFNVCGFSNVPCGEQYNPQEPLYGVASYRNFDTGCATVGGDALLLTPLNVSNPKTGGIRVSHSALYPTSNCVGSSSRFIEYNIQCDKTVDTVVVDSAQADEHGCNILMTMRSKYGCGKRRKSGKC